MDDPWANAWGEPVKPIQGSHSIWAHESTQDLEADIAAPSWVTGAEIRWTEPSEDQSTLWQPASPAKAWMTSPYEDITLGSTSLHSSTQPSEQQPADDDLLPLTRETPTRTPPSPDATTGSPTPLSSAAPSPAPPPPIYSNSDSPDAFGTFEVGLDLGNDGVDPWSEPVKAPTSEYTDSAADSWTRSDLVEPAGRIEVEDQVPNIQVDEWEEAKRQKEKQDQHVPPLVLASVLNDFQTFANELWNKTSHAPTDTGFLENRHSGIEGVEGLMTVIDQIIPTGQSLPQYIPFSKTFTAKHMSEAIRLTRNVEITRTSPFTLYMASKGSTAWETSVKSRLERTVEDLVPPGWRVLENEKEDPTVTVDHKKTTGAGILSFFGRRSVTSPVTTDAPRPAHQNHPSTASIHSNSARSSVDTAKDRSVSEPTPAIEEVISVNVLSTGSKNQNQSNLFPQGTDSSEPPQAPSVVSRFLSRFSRSKSSAPGVSDSIALSTDDVEFLSDIVPSAHDDVDVTTQLEDLSNMISSSTLVTKLPPLLPPPPRTKSSFSNQQSLPPLPSTDAQNGVDFTTNFDTATNTLSRDTATPITSPVLNHFTSRTPSFSGPLSTALIEPQSTGSSSSSRRVPSASFDTQPPSSRTQTPAGVRRVPIAIMSSGPFPTNSQSVFALPPPPILPPPPTPGLKILSSEPPAARPSSRPTTGSVLPANKNGKFIDDEVNIYSSPPPPPPRPSQKRTQVFNQSLDFSDHRSSPPLSGNHDLFDDFDDFVSLPTADSPKTLLSLSTRPSSSQLNSSFSDTFLLADHRQSLASFTQPHPPSGTLQPPPPPQLSIGIDFFESPPVPKAMPSLESSPPSSNALSSPASHGLNQPILPLSSPSRPSNFSTSAFPVLNGTDIPGQFSLTQGPSGSKSNKLSAQDLSFFEGL